MQVFAEMYWVPGDLMQAEDRAHRVGQACKVACNYLLLADSIDGMMWDILVSKTRNMGTVLDGRRGNLAVRCASLLSAAVLIQFKVLKCS